MPPALTPEAWAQIRADYEHTDRPTADICAEHGISTGTLRDRIRRWGWTPRRQPIPFEGPPPAPPIDVPPFAATRQAGMETLAASPHIETPPFAGAPDLPAVFAGEAAGGNSPAEIVPRLQNAVASVLPAIEATVARLAAGATHPRELERASRTLAALTRTLRELNGLLEQRRAADAAESPPPNLEQMRAELARKIEALVRDDAELQTASSEVEAALDSDPHPARQ